MQRKDISVYCDYLEDIKPRLEFIKEIVKQKVVFPQCEAFGEALEATIVLSFISEAIPVIYNGQEAGNTKRLRFFEHAPLNGTPNLLKS